MWLRAATGQMGFRRAWLDQGCPGKTKMALLLPYNEQELVLCAREMDGSSQLHRAWVSSFSLRLFTFPLSKCLMGAGAFYTEWDMNLKWSNGM